MKVTKYPQSCLLLDKDGKRIVIDLGNFFAAQYSVGDLGQVEAVFYTHQHPDHYDQAIAEEFKSRGVPLHGNADVAALIGAGAIEVKSGVSLTVAGFDVLPHDIPHFQKPGVEMPHNTGYIIDGNFFHPGDGIINNGVSVNNLAAPVGGPFGFEATIEFIRSVGATKVVPIHYSNQELYPTDPQEFMNLGKDTAEIVLLDDGESIDI